LRVLGWRHAILSNHVPELPSMVSGLGLSHLIDVVFTSAATGYEKPNPRAFEIALEACGWPSESWMVGDNPIADIAGAEAFGIPAVLVGNKGRHVRNGACIDAHLAHFEESEAAGTAFTLGFTQGARAFLSEDSGS
jgi:FMN phosphatase YigB (HAD superfamily)